MEELNSLQKKFAEAAAKCETLEELEALSSLFFGDEMSVLQPRKVQVRYICSLCLTKQLKIKVIPANKEEMAQDVYMASCGNCKKALLLREKEELVEMLLSTLHFGAPHEKHTRWKREKENFDGVKERAISGTKDLPERKI